MAVVVVVMVVGLAVMQEHGTSSSRHIRSIRDLSGGEGAREESFDIKFKLFGFRKLHGVPVHLRGDALSSRGVWT